MASKPQKTKYKINTFPPNFNNLSEAPRPIVVKKGRHKEILNKLRVQFDCNYV